MGVPEPEYTLLGDDLTVKFTALESAIISDLKTLNRQSGGLDGGLNGGLDEDLADRIIALISSDSTITVSKISETLNISKRTAERAMKQLRENGRIIRNGGNRHGYWKVI